MKRLLCVLLACMLLCTLALPMTASAEENPWDETYYRVIDYTGELSDETQSQLDGECIEFMKKYHLDYAAVLAYAEQLDGTTAQEIAEYEFEDAKFGYNYQDGFMLVYVLDTGELSLFCFGEAGNIFTQEQLQKIVDFAASMREQYDVWGVVYGGISVMNSFFEKGIVTPPYGAASITDPEPAPATDTDPAPATDPEPAPATDPDPAPATDTDPAPATDTDPAPATDTDPEPVKATGYDAVERVGEGDEMPPWFPRDIKRFRRYHDASAPRVVDKAEIFSESAEKKMAERIAVISAETGKDIVIVTDVSTYGLGEKIYSADYYDYCGYGIGPDYDGLCLMICMDPNDRGGWTCATGDATRALFTSTNANRLDDPLYAGLKEGDYDAAVLEWIENVYSMYTTGIASAPAWYPSDGVAPKNYQNPNAPIVYDEMNILEASEISELEQLSKEILRDYDVNVYFLTTLDNVGFSSWDNYYSFYYQCMGYPEDSVLCVVRSSYDDGAKYFDAKLFGNTKELIPEKFRERIENTASTKSPGFGELESGAKCVQAYLKNGRVPRSNWYWGFLGAAAVVIAFIYAIISTDNAKRSMRVPKAQTNAAGYEKSTVVSRIYERYLYSNITRTYVAPKETSSSSGSSGRSSYSSSYSGHSGVSHSGSGRKF